jgi:hypothetical protein
MNSYLLICASQKAVASHSHVNQTRCINSLDMGGMGFIQAAECEIMHNSALVNAHMIHAAAIAKVPAYFFSSSACVYPDMEPGAPEPTEQGAYPAMPDKE